MAALFDLFKSLFRLDVLDIRYTSCKVIISCLLTQYDGRCSNFFVISFTPTKITQGPISAKTPCSRRHNSRRSIPTSGKAMICHHYWTSCVERPETSHAALLVLLCCKSDVVVVILIHSHCLSCAALSACPLVEERLLCW